MRSLSEALYPLKHVGCTDSRAETEGAVTEGQTTDSCESPANEERGPKRGGVGQWLGHGEKVSVTE